MVALCNTADLIFLPCGFFFFMVALCNRADHYIFMLWFVLLLIILFPRLISAAADWMSAILPHMVCLSANLRCGSETCCTRLAETQDAKKSPKLAIWAPSHNFVGLYLRN